MTHSRYVGALIVSAVESTPMHHPVCRGISNKVGDHRGSRCTDSTSVAPQPSGPMRVVLFAGRQAVWRSVAQSGRGERFFALPSAG